MALTAAQEVASIFAGTLFYGLYLSTLLHCLRWLVFADEGWTIRNKIRWTMLVITIILFVATTINTALGLQNSMVRVMINTQPEPASPPGSTWITMTLPWVAIVKCTDSNVSILLADAVLIYRTWMIYSRSRWVIIFPVFLWIGGVVLTVLQAYHWKSVPSISILNAWKVINMPVRPEMILIPFWASTVILNSYSTLMITLRIYRIARGSEAISSSSIHRPKFVVRVLVESGVLYIAVAIAHFVSSWSPVSHSIYGLSTIYMSVTGIAFNLILIRVARSRAQDTRMVAQLQRIPSIHFTPRKRTPAGQVEVGTISAISFRSGRADSDSVVQDHISTTASAV